MIGFSRDCLASFTSRTRGLKSPDTSGCSLNPGPVWTALGRSSGTLKKLDIDFDQQRHGRDLWDDTIQDDGCAETQDAIISRQLDAVKRQKEKDGKLPQFPHLTCLTISIRALMELMLSEQSSGRLVDVLPSHLEELIIRGYDAKTPTKRKPQLDELVKEKATKLPKLVVVEGIDELIPNGQDVDPYWNDGTQHRHPNGNKENGNDTDSD